MAKAYITEYKGMARDPANAPVPAPEMPSLAEQAIEIGLKSTTSAPFSQHVKFISVKAGGPCCIAIGKDPVAKPGFHPLDAGEVRWYGVYPGHKIAVVVYSGDSVLFNVPVAAEAEG